MSNIEFKDCVATYGGGAFYCGACQQVMAFIRSADCGRPGCPIKEMGENVRAMSEERLREVLQRMQEGKTSDDD